MDWSSVAGVVPVASAVGAAVGGVISFAVNWYWKAHELTDKIQVHYGQSLYEETPGYAMYVVSRRKHPMELRDYGFVLKDGRLVSAPMVWAECHGNEQSFDAATPSRLLESVNSRFEIIMELGFDDVVAAYAKTTSQRWPVIAFSPWASVSWLDKARIRWKQRTGTVWAR